MTFDLSYTPLTWEQYAAIIAAGTIPGRTSPMTDRPDYDSLIRVFGAANIDPRVALAITWQEGHQGSDPGLVAAPYHNLGGVKWVGQQGAFDTGIAADTGGTYAGFADLSVYWAEVVRILNNSIIGPSFRAGDLAGAMDHWTNGPGTGTPKVQIYQSLLADYPPSGPLPANTLTGDHILVVARTYLGQVYSDGSDGNTPLHHEWWMWCESFVEAVHRVAGLADFPRFFSALAHLRAVTVAMGSRAPAGAQVFFDERTDPNGHIGIAVGDGSMICTMRGGIEQVPNYEQWAGYAGWRYATGVGAGAGPVVSDNFVPGGNPWNAGRPLTDLLGVGGAFKRLYLSTPYPLQAYGYPVTNEHTATVVDEDNTSRARTVQEFERATFIYTPESGVPWDAVAALRKQQIKSS